jgi:hypothetical protein
MEFGQISVIKYGIAQYISMPAEGKMMHWEIGVLILGKPHREGYAFPVILEIGNRPSMKLLNWTN